MRILFNFFIPGSILIAGAIFFLNSQYSQQLAQQNLDLGATILTLLCALLAWRFDRSRVIYTLQLLVIVVIADRYMAASSFSWQHLSFILLVNLILVAVMRERGIHSLRGLFLCALPMLQSVGFFFLIRTKQFNFETLLSTSILNLPETSKFLPESLLVLIAVALIIQGIRFIRYKNPLEGALFWTIFAVAAAVLQPGPLHITLLYAASILAILISFVEMSYTLAYRDELTGVPGRRALMEAFKKLGNRYSIAMVDIDFFKKFNDKYGHDIGDQVLKMVAARLSKCSGGGRAYRYGGEEFCVVFPGKNSEDCLEELENLRTSIGEQPFTIRKITRPLKKPKKSTNRKKKQNSVKVTVSIGVAEKTPLYNQPEIVMKRADQALYRAKEGGRNRVCT